jgi:hypothetical protein
MEHDGRRWNKMEHDGTRWNRWLRCHVPLESSVLGCRRLPSCCPNPGASCTRTKWKQFNQIRSTIQYTSDKKRLVHRLVHTNLVQRLKNTMHNLPTNWVASCTSTPAHTQHHCQWHRQQWHRHCPRHVRSRTRAWQCCRCWCLRGRAGCA